jgi:hypothetical protein
MNGLLKLIVAVGSALLLHQHQRVTIEAFVIPGVPSSRFDNIQLPIDHKSKRSDPEASCVHRELYAPPLRQSKIAEDFELFVLSTLFGSLDNDKDTKHIAIQDPNKILLNFTDLVIGGKGDIVLAQESLERYLTQWAFMLETDKGITTPITSSNKPLIRHDGSTDVNTTVRSDYVRIMFRPPPRYISYNEQKDMEKGVLPDRKGAKMDSKSPGGVQLKIKMECGDNEYKLSLTATRCGIDDDTVIKVSSERTIVRRLKDAVRIWKKTRAL